MNEHRSILLGMVALGLFATREIVFIFRGQSENGVWACYVALLLIGVGLMVRSAACNAVGTFWLTVGFPLWIVDMLAAGGTESTSVLTHISGVILGYTGMKQVGLPSRTWVFSILGLAVLIVISRPLTTAAENINFSYRVYEGVDRLFPSYWSYMLALFGAFTTISLILQWGLPKVGFRKA
ncbi:MAG: hypothetical protein LAO55_28240 [Acidobacteriia bacterium]|nr:hypothetical protein [Terriglobia bacterium]